MVKIGFWNLYAVQRVGEWVGVSLLCLPYLFLTDSTEFYSEQWRNTAGIVFSAFWTWGVIFVFSGWLLISLLSFFLYRRFKRPRSYAWASMLFSASWSFAWIFLLGFASGLGLSFIDSEFLSLWLLGLTSNYFVALWTHRWLIRWPGPVAT